MQANESNWTEILKKTLYDDQLVFESEQNYPAALEGKNVGAFVKNLPA